MTASQIDGLLALYDAGILHQSCVQFFREGWKTFFRSPHETVSHAPLSRSKVLPVVSILGSAGVGKTWLLCRLKEHALALPFASPLIGFSSCDIGGHAVVFMDTNPTPIPSVTSSTTVSLSEQQALMRDSIRDVEDHVRDAHRLTELVYDLGSLSQVDAQILVVGDDMDAAAQQHLARMHLASAERGKPLIVVHVWKHVRSWELSLEAMNACLAEVSQILQLKGTVAKVKGAFEMHIGCSKHIILPREPERLTNLQKALFKAGFDRIKDLLTIAISQNKATSDKAALSPPDLLKDIATKLSKLLPGKYIATTLRRSREFVVLHDAQNHLLRPFYVDEEGEHVPVPLSITQMLRSFAPSPSNVLYNTSRSRGKSKNGQPVWINVVSIVLPSLDGCRALARIRDQLQWGTQSLEVEYNPGAESPKHDSEVRAVETKDGPKSAILEDDPQRKKAQEADDPKGNTSVAVDPRTLKSITFWAVLREVPESLVASLGAEDPLLEASINSRFATYDVHICVHTHIERCLKDVPPCILYGSGLLTVTVLSELSTQEQQNAPLASVLAQPEPTEARDCHPPEPQRGDEDASSRSSPDPTLNGPQYDGCDE